VRRLLRAAKDLGIGELDAALARRAFDELTAACFGDRDGVVRLQASRDAVGQLHLVGLPRPLGDEPAEWSAIVVRIPHDGAGLAPGLKVSSRLTMALAGDAAREAAADEALLLDPADHLVEGARSNVVVVNARGTPTTPPVARGAVSGIARGVALERVPELVEGEISASELRAAGEVVALNAVHGARPITRLDGAPVGDGRHGPWARRLAAALADD
jgi:branched-subunit amino acid aminotransferase/4-amino-4-deoxychorismate lyase